MQYSYIILFFLFTFVKSNVNIEKQALDINEFHKFQRENKNTDPYLHTDKLFDALHNGLKSFEHIEIKDTTNKTVRNYAQISSQALHKTTTTTELFQDKQYFSLDDNNVSQNIQEIGERYLIDCANNDVRIGDYYIGTSDSNHKDITQQSNQGSQVGFIFSRQVKSIQENGHCKKITTEIVHPLQIMNTKIVSEISFPYNRIYIPVLNLSGLNDTSRQLIEKSAFLQPDPPLLLCDNEKVLSKQGGLHKNGGGRTTIYGIPIDYSYALDTKGTECVDISTTVPGSINFNHASGLKAINPSIKLGDGITCTNCYSFLGAGILAVFNIFGGDTSTFAFQAKSAGGAGYNIGILLRNPTVSASKYFNLAKAGPVSSIPIVAGLSLKINFGGAWATIKGSGTARGSATFSSGYTLEESDYVMYAKSKWSAGHKLINSNQIKPTYSDNGIKLSTTMISVIASISARIQYKFGGSIPIVNVGATIDFSTVLTATAQYIKGKSQQSLSLSMDDNRKLLSRTRFRNTDSTHHYYPGDIVHIKINYDGLNPNENHELYFNLHKSTDEGKGYPIIMHKFKSSHTGNGETKVTWRIPYDSKFTQDNCENPEIQLSAHTSAKLDRHYLPNKICLTNSRNDNTNPTFQYPETGIVYHTSRPINIKWDKDRLKHFKHIQGTDGLGSEQNPKHVNFIVVSKNTGNAYQIANNINNTGSYYAYFPDSILKDGARFFMVIHDSRENSRIAWQNGNFELRKPPYNIDINASKSNILVPVNFAPPIMEDGIPLWNKERVSQPVIFINNTTIMEKSRRSLIGPNNCRNAALSILLQIEFGFDGFTVLGRQCSLGSTVSNPFTIVPQTNFCIG